MLVVVFSNSVEGLLKYAQHCGNQGGLEVRVPVRGGQDNGEEVLSQAHMHSVKEKKKTCSLEGTAQDVFCFALGLNMGDISGDACSQQRKESAAIAAQLFPTELPCYLEDVDRSAEAFGALVERAEQGEPIRIWYSDQPDEMCGMLWFLSELKRRMQHLPTVLRLKQPTVYQVGSTMVSNCGWGGVDPEHLHVFLPLAQQVTPEYLSYADFEWKRLRREQMPLRVVLNGRVQSVPLDFYDSFLEREVDSMPDEFSEAELIGKVLCTYQLGVGDLFLAQRVEAMIEAGKLVPVTEPKPGEIIYRRRLRKCTV